MPRDVAAFEKQFPYAPLRRRRRVSPRVEIVFFFFDDAPHRSKGMLDVWRNMVRIIGRQFGQLRFLFRPRQAMHGAATAAAAARL